MNSGIPAVSCTCGQGHHLHAQYYVSVMRDGGEVVLALGPFATHPEALDRVSMVSNVVMDHYNPDGRAVFYHYGTVAMPGGYTTPGKLNGQVPWPEVINMPAPKRRRRKAVTA